MVDIGLPYSSFAKTMTDCFTVPLIRLAININDMYNHFRSDCVYLISTFSQRGVYLKNFGIVFILVLLLMLISGCTPSTYEITGYTGSSINNEIPVPVNAKQLSITTHSDNPNIKTGINYELKHIGGEQGLYVPSDYFEKLSEAGWVELEEERMGHVHFLKKSDTIIAIEIREDTFEIFEMMPDFTF